MKTKNIQFIIVGLALQLLHSATAQAAPIPGTATSTLVTPRLGIYRSAQGFQIEAGQSGWAQAQAPAENKFVSALFKAPTKPGAGEAGSLTVRVDQIAKELPLDKYVQRWMKEYPKYGFDVIGSLPFVQNKEKGYVLDLLNRDSGRQLRQVVFMKKTKAVILTCRDQAAAFKDTLKSCNQIIRTFQWTEQN
jgi:hypothetical protein